ncbi:MAG: hypothetical protein LQ344_001273 [Seirophora lacunosa]|nr:MAG: hypothetical protein LQ344_001273 [Seirophora lacunosa]
MASAVSSDVTVEELRAQLAQVQLQKEQADKRAEEERGRADAEKARAEEAEAVTQSTTFEELLEHCHKQLFQQFQVETDDTRTTRGDAASPGGKLQQKAFDTLYAHLHPEGSPDNAKRIFLDAHGIRSIGGYHLRGRKISSEDDLRLFESTAIANMVRDVIMRISIDEELRNHLGLDAGASVSFENHANALNTGNVELQARQPPTTPTKKPDPTGKLADTQGVATEKIQAQQPPTTPTPAAARPYDHGGGITKADNYCVYHAEGQHRKLLYAVEFKAPHKVTKEILRTGLHEMNLSRDVIHRTTVPGDDDEAALFKYHAERITAAVLTQTYQYMIQTGAVYSCVITGEAIVFLWVPADSPTDLHFHLAEPGLEVGEGKDMQLNRTAIAQTLSFLFMALQTKTRDRDWRNKAKAASKEWEVDMMKILAAIPATLRASHPESPAWKPTKFPAHVTRTSKYFTRRVAMKMKKKQLFTKSDDHPRDTPRSDSEEPDSDDPDGPGGKTRKAFPATPTPDPATRQPRRAKQPNWQKSDHNDHYNRAYCTQQCLLGLARGLALDPACPHVESHRKHGSTHHSISAEQLCVSLQQQLGRRLAYNCTDLEIYGSRCMLFKVSTAAHGYTFIAKGTIGRFLRHLEHEAQVYNRLRQLEGFEIPVYLGSIDLAKPILDFGGVEIIHMLLLAYGGKTVLDDEVEVPSDLHAQVKSFEKKLQGFGFEHGDLEKRNILWNAATGRIMFIDFERSKPLSRAEALQEVTPHRQRWEPATSHDLAGEKVSGFEIYDDGAIPSPKTDCTKPRKDDAVTQALMSDLFHLDEDLMIAQLWSEDMENIVPAATAPGLTGNGKKRAPLTCIPGKQVLVASATKDDKPYITPSKTPAVKEVTEDDKENIVPIIVE